MQIWYGADPATGQGGVEMKLAMISDYMIEAIFTEDKTTFLWDHVALRCLCWLNPAATNIGGSPTLTATNLVSFLQQSRKTLLITLNSSMNDGAPQETLLQSPYPGAKTDAQFGPHCLVKDFNVNHGNGLIGLDLEFHTDIAPCGGVGTGSKSVILANRFEYKVSYDEETYAEIRTISGMVIFRQDNLQAVLNGQLDLVREFVVPPCPVGFQRMPPLDFTPSSDNNALRYEIQDRQMARSAPTAQQFGIADIEISEVREYAVGPFNLR